MYMIKIFLAICLVSFPTLVAASPLDFSASWTSDSGDKSSLAQWKGSKVVLAMLYPKCTSACPLVLHKLKAIQEKLDEKRIKAEFILISFDSENESAQRLSEYRQHMSLTQKNWHLLFGLAKDVRTFSNLVNIHFWISPKTHDISHDNVVLLLNENGSIQRRLEGLDAKVDDLF